jgi:Flp pilus assembly protein TadB
VRVLAALAFGTCCALVTAAIAGTMPRRRPRGGRTGRLALRRARAELWLQQAGVGLGLGAFWAGSAFAGLFSLLAVSAVTGSVFVAAVPSVAVALLPRTYFGRRRRSRMREVQAAWPDGLRDIVSSIAAGLSLTQAMTNVAATGPPALRVALARFPQLARVLGTGPALELLKEDLADATSDRVLEVLILAQERGGAIVRDSLEDLVAATTRDLKLLEELETEGLEMRINARAVMVLPWFVLVALTARPGAFRTFYRSSGGVVTLALAGVLTLVGVAVLGRLGREPIEARPFASAGGS